jgi:hypothetical protein
MSVQRKLAELKAECNKLDLEVHQSRSKESKQDFVDALAKYYREFDPRKGQYGFEFMVSIKSSMLCQRLN